jgi:hypothetical protein
MRISNESVYKMAEEVKISVKEFVKKRPARLQAFLKTLSPQDQEFILSQFDRYGYYAEYEKTGIRVINGKTGECEAFKLGFHNLDNYKGTNTQRKLAEKKLRSRDKMKPTDSMVTIPSTNNLMDAITAIISKKTFNKPIRETLIYSKIKRLKPVIDKISEAGIDEENVKKLDDIFINMDSEKKNVILAVFDSKNPYINFAGVRYNKAGKLVPVDKNNNQCIFAYNSLNLRSTIDILNVWKELEGLK